MSNDDIVGRLSRAIRVWLVASSAIAPFAAGAWRSVGPYGGDAEFVRISRSRPDVVIAGTRRGTIYRLERDGAGWTPIAAPAAPGCSLHALEIHPQAPDSWYAGFDCGEIPSNAGLYETSDGGVNWRRPVELLGLGVWSIAFSASTKRVVAGTTAGVFGHFGDGWRRLSPESNKDLKPVVSLAFDPIQEDVIFAGTTHLPWRTIDGGNTWSSIHSGMLDDSDVFSISPDRNRNGLVYASACSGVYRSSTGGSRWARLPTPPGAFRAYLVTPDPHAPQVVFAATSLGLLRSRDGGATWVKLINDIVHSVAFHPTLARHMYITSTTSGVLVTSNGGDRFQPIDRGFANRQFRALAGASEFLYVANTDDAGPSLFQSVDGGATWRSSTAWPRNLRHVVMGSKNTATAFTGSSSRVYATYNSGKDWAALPELPGGRVLGLSAHGDGVMAAGVSGVYSFGVGSPQWAKLELHEQINPQSLYSGPDGFIAINGDKALVVSTNDGKDWQSCPGITDQRSIHSIAGSGGSTGYVLAGTTNGLMRSGDGCGTWTTVVDGIERGTVSMVYIDPTQSSAVFAVQHGRIYASGDRGISWKPLSDEGRMGDFPIALHSSGSPTRKLFALLSRTGVIVQDAVTAQAANNFPGDRYSAPAQFNNQGDYCE